MCPAPGPPRSAPGTCGSWSLEGQAIPVTDRASEHVSAHQERNSLNCFLKHVFSFHLVKEGGLGTLPLGTVFCPYYNEY